MVHGVFFPSKLEDGSGAAGAAGFGEGGPEGGGGPGAGAMHRNDPGWREKPQLIGDPPDAGIAGSAQVHAADHGADGAVAGQAADVFQDMDDAGVGAAQEDHGAGGGFHVQRLVIEQGIDRLALGIEMEQFRQGFFGMGPGNFAGAEEAGGELAGIAGGDHAGIGAVEGLSGGIGDADGARPGAVDMVLSLQRIGMQMDIHRFADGGQDDRQAAGVIVVAVAEHQGVHGAEIDAQGAGVVRQDQPLAGVEQNAAVAER